MACQSPVFCPQADMHRSDWSATTHWQTRIVWIRIIKLFLSIQFPKSHLVGARGAPDCVDLLK